MRLDRESEVTVTFVLGSNYHDLREKVFVIRNAKPPSYWLN